MTMWGSALRTPASLSMGTEGGRGFVTHEGGHGHLRALPASLALTTEVYLGATSIAGSNDNDRNTGGSQKEMRE